VPDSATRLVSLHDPDARPIRKRRLGKPVEFGYKAQIVDNTDGVILDHTVETGNPRTHHSWRRRSHGSPAAPATHHERSPPTEGYGQARVERDLHDLGVRTVAIPRRGKPGAARREVEHRRAFHAWSNGAPDPKAGSTTSSAATAGTAPNSPPSPAPEPGADTAYSPTTWSRSARWQPDNHPTASRARPTGHRQPDRPAPRHHDDRRFFRSK
jgi:hypothetical protein